MRFWLERGVDGFRLDTVNFYVHDRELRDNPAWVPGTKRTEGVPEENPYSLQMHLYDKTRPENLDFLKRLRALLDDYPAITTVGEIGADDSLEVMADYTSGGDKLHMAYSFNLLTREFSTGHIRNVVETAEARLGDGWPCWSLGNHDTERVLSRWGGDQASPELAKVLGALLGSLRGSVCIYQGEELGLSEAEVPPELMQDPYGIEFWPDFKGRDGCRTPMPWTGEASDIGGFSHGNAWLPMPEEHRRRSIAVQQGEDGSVLESYRQFLRWRHGRPALRKGAITFLDAPDGLLAIERSHEGERLLCLFNLTDRPVEYDVRGAETLIGHGFDPVEIQDDQVRLQAFGAYFGRIRQGEE